MPPDPPIPPEPTDPTTAALGHLQAFAQRVLPGALRRITAWKRLPPARARDLAADVAQELALDCLQHGAAIAALPERSRHARWLRLAERWVYQQHARRALRGGGREPDALAAAAAPAAGADLPEPDALAFAALGNGRCNLTATARRLGCSVHRVRRGLERLAQDLGCDAEWRRFWRRRLAEALAGLAADLLQTRQRLHLLPVARRPPDPAARLQRLRRIGAQLPLLRATRRERELVRRWLGRARAAADAPQRLAADAVALWPGHGAAWLWLAEAHCAAAAPAAALRALRGHRAWAGGATAAVVLARARVLELRGRGAAALALVRRAARRWPRDPTLAAAQRALDGADA